jgi:branched-subunit amino acid aminotransferase/4-amino-4-deoxychorismate lyase
MTSTPEATIYQDGEYFPASEARLSPLDDGVRCGFSLYETIRITEGAKSFRLEAHLSRLARSAERFGLAGVPDSAHVRTACARLAAANGIESGRLRITLVSRGGEDSGDTLFMALTPVLPPADDAMEKGWSCRRAPFRRTLGPKEEGILLNDAGRLCEGCYTNLFLVSGGRAVTPSLAEGPLPGVTRHAVLEVAGGSPSSVDERPLTWEDLARGEEAFLTNALVGLVPLTSAEGRPIGTGRPGPFTRGIREAFLKLVRRERV